jgi:hypothetical protein
MHLALGGNQDLGESKTIRKPLKITKLWKEIWCKKTVFKHQICKWFQLSKTFVKLQTLYLQNQNNMILEVKVSDLSKVVRNDSESPNFQWPKWSQNMWVVWSFRGAKTQMLHWWNTKFSTSQNRSETLMQLYVFYIENLIEINIIVLISFFQNRYQTRWKLIISLSMKQLWNSNITPNYRVQIHLKNL